MRKRKKDAETITVGQAVTLAATIRDLTNMLWMQHISTHKAQDRDPFPSPRALSEFIENSSIVTAGVIMRDKELTTSALRTMGLDEFADGITTGVSWPDEPAVEFPSNVFDEGIRKLLG